MDGRPLTEMLEGEAAEADVAIGEAAGDAPVLSAAADEGYTDEDQAVISERLRALGYID
jgi:hypothetical protein